MAGTDRQQAEKLGYLGLGMMGSPMARRLVARGADADALEIYKLSASQAG